MSRFLNSRENLVDTLDPVEANQIARTKYQTIQSTPSKKQKIEAAEAVLDAQVLAKIAQVKLQVEEWKKSKLND